MTMSSLAESAYSALRTLGNARGEETLNRVLEVRGEGGQEPAAWKIVVADPRAKSGVREIEVRKGKITGETSPRMPRATDQPMDLNLLNLDSEGAMEVVATQTDAVNTAERISYTLANGADSGTPVWTVRVQPPRQGPPTSMQIAADTGAIIASTMPATTLDPVAAYATTEATGRAPASTVTETEVREPGAAVNAEDGSEPDQKHFKRFRDSSVEVHVPSVPKVARKVIRQAERPVRLLRRILP
jgi:hypothetical protein